MGERLLTLVLGNFELLEATTSHPQVLPGRRRSNIPQTDKLHEWIPRGKLSSIPQLSSSRLSQTNGYN